MYCIQHTYKDIWFNLAAEEYLLKHTNKNYFMLWQSDPAVVVGKHQDIDREVNLDYTTSHQIGIARRYTGGGTVYHDGGNVNLTFIETSRFPNFDKYTTWIMEALAPFGLPVRTDERRGIYIGDRKISGSAQSIWKDRVLYHATLLYASDLGKLQQVLEISPIQAIISAERKKVYVGSVKSPVTNIVDHLPRPVSIETFRNYLSASFRFREGMRRVYSFNEAEMEAIHRLRENKYLRSEWIYNSPADKQARVNKTF